MMRYTNYAISSRSKVLFSLIFVNNEMKLAKGTISSFKVLLYYTILVILYYTCYIILLGLVIHQRNDLLLYHTIFAS